jgi:4-amino-4-deoxy-L-arabinose transferase-like glycosyltransferase
MNVFLFIVSITLVSFTVYSQQKILKLPDRIDRVLVWFVLFPANIVLITTILSELYWISLNGYLVLQTVFALVWLGIYYKFRPPTGEPSKPSAGNNGLDEPNIILRRTLQVFLGVIVLAALFRFFIGIYTPVTLHDSWTCHLARVGYWLQHGTMHHYNTQTAIQNYQAPNVQILMLWTVAFLKSDILANLVQWFAYCGLGFALYQATMNLGHGKTDSLLSSLVFLSLPMVVLQSISTFYDLGVTFFAITFLYFFHSGIKNKQNNRMLLSGISFGLAVGAKGTIYYMLPAIFLVCIGLIIIYKPGLRFFKRIVVYFFLGLLCFGVYNYIQNYKSYGNIFASQEDIKAVHRHAGINLEKTFLNFIKHGYESIEFTGLPDFMIKYLNKQKKIFFDKYLGQKYISKYGRKFTFRAFDGYNNSERVGWFGILGTLIIIPTLLYFFFSIFYIRSRENLERWFYAFIPATFYLIFCMLQVYTHNKSRYFVLPFAFLIPLTAFVFKRKRQSLKIILFIIVTLIAIKTTVLNSIYSKHKPLIGKKTIFNNSYYQNNAMLHPRHDVPLLRFVNEFTKPNSRIGHILNANEKEYFFFGKNFDRTVIPVEKSELKNGEISIIDKYNLDFLVLDVPLGEGSTNSSYFDPCYSAALFARRPAYLRVIPPGKNWYKTINNYFSSTAEPTVKEIQNYIQVFSCANNLNIPLKIFLHKAEGIKGLKPVIIGKQVIELPLRKTVIKWNYGARSSNIIAFTRPGSVIAVNGKVNGKQGVVTVVDEIGNSVMDIPVQQNGRFEKQFPVELLREKNSKYKLFQIKTEWPKSDVKILTVKVRISVQKK